MYKKISFRSVPKARLGKPRRVFHCADAVESRYAANTAPMSSGGTRRKRARATSGSGGAHDCARQGAPLRPLLLRFVEALNTPVVAPVMGLFGGRRDLLFVNPFKKMTKGPCKFHLLQGACSSPVVCSASLFLPCSLQGYRLRCLCPGRNAAWPQRAAASCFAQPHVGCGHDALQIRDLTELRRLVGACLKPALPKQNADSAKVPDQRSTTTRRYRPSGLQERVRRVVLHRIRDTGPTRSDTWR